MLLGLPASPVKCSLMADAADAITNGFNESLLGVNLNKRLMCWFHCKNAIDKKLSLIRDLASRAVVITQIVIMQLSQTPEIFQAAVIFFLEQWTSNTDVNPGLDSFLENFRKE